MANNYKLTINDVYGKGKGLELTYNQGKTSSQVMQTNSINCTFTLKNFSYTKAIYQPGEIQITLILTKEKDSFSLSEVKAIHSSLINKGVKLEFSEKTPMSDAFEIANDYFTFDIQIERKKGSSGVLAVYVKAFDPLKFLTLDKYCMAYTCKKLIKNIILNDKVWPNNTPISFADKLQSAQTAIDEINKLKYEITQDNTKEKKNKEAIKNKEKESFILMNSLFLTYPDSTNKTYSEFIQPYLVQYNESFFDFLVRVTNRCGEFLYYENGKIHIGWEETDSIDLGEYVSIKYPQEIGTAWTDSAIADIHNDYTQAKNKNLKNTNNPTMMRDCELASDENLASIPPKEDYTCWKDFALYPGCFYVNLVSDSLCSQNLVDMIMDLGVSTAATISSSTKLSNDANDAYETQNFSGTYKEERMQGDNIHPFSTNDTNKSGVKDKQVAYSLAYYTNIQKGIESAERSRIKIELGDYFYKVSLGSIVKFDGDEYIVVKIDSQIDSQNKINSEILNIEVIPYTKGETVYPPSAHVDSIRQAKAQRAIVTHNQDPLKMNRVRVRYPWQGTTDSTTSEDSSPWIRIALPMASDGSGFNFLPEVGDEAMINFENGNIERPYVEGMLYSNGQTVPGDYKRTGARFITSVNGHSIIFSDPGKMNVLRTIMPMFKTIGGFMGTPEISINDRKAIGGIELTDEYGLYSIAMSSSNRSITINSPLGNVSINAFTGIKISAPNGNISIEGKNINIAAGNNLTISSGNNISSTFWPFKHKGPWKDFGLDIADFGLEALTSGLKKFQPIDMKLLRTIIETFLRPIGGTMLIKSNRYMRLEAGDGTARIVGRNFIKQRWGNIKEFFKGSLFHKGSDILEEFHISDYVFQIVNSIKIFILHLYDYHRTKSVNIIPMYINYDLLYDRIKEIDNFDNKINGTLKDKEEVFSDAKNNIDYNRISPKDDAPYEITVACNSLNFFGTILSKRLKEYNDEDVVWEKFYQFLYSSCKEIVNDADIKAKISAIYQPVCWLKNHNLVINDNTELNKGEMREVLYLVLTKAIKRYRSDSYNISIETGFSDFDDEEKWNKLIDKITFTEQTRKRRKFGDYLMGLVDIKDLEDQYVWDKTETGEILFSNKKGKTLRFTDNGITDYERIYDGSAKLNELKDILRV